MTSASPPSHATAHESGTAEWTTRALIARHKRLAAAAAAGLLIMAGLFLVVALSPRSGIVRDSTSCAQWSTSNQSEQQAYAQRYLRGHGRLPGGATGVRAVEAAVNAGCMAAFGSDLEDKVTTLDAITKNY